VEPDATWLLPAIRTIHEQIRSAVTSAFESSNSEALSSVVDDSEGDTIFAVDRISESLLVELFEREIASRVPIVLIAEGLHGGSVVLPRGARESQAKWRIIADPIDGTRCLMYQKRSGWILTGVAPNRGAATSLADIELAVQTELPLIKQHLCDTLWAVRGHGAHAQRLNRITGEIVPFTPQPSSAKDLAHGFSAIARFFSGGRDILAAIDDEIAAATLKENRAGKSYAFEDQYLSTGGQLYELMIGHDRFLADLRPLLAPIILERGLQSGLCCHPYDLCTELIAREAGVIVTNESGRRLDASLDLDANVSWVGYANQHLRDLIAPVLNAAMQRQGLMASNRREQGPSGS
jgi:fructose-1,6-bisphosphatase/inositol monophosphatase family enzyme